MKNILPIFLVCCFFTTSTKAQSLPANTCGIVYTYDAAGNRTQRAYVCNNGGGIAPVFTENTSEVIQQVTELYPNPTTGRFTVLFTRELKNAPVILYDINGKELQRSKRSGNQLLFDLTPYAAGVYLLRIEDEKNLITFKVVKK